MRVVFFKSQGMGNFIQRGKSEYSGENEGIVSAVYSTADHIVNKRSIFHQPDFIKRNPSPNRKWHFTGAGNVGGVIFLPYNAPWKKEEI